MSLKDLPGFLREEAEEHDSTSEYAVYMEEAARIIESLPINMGHIDSIQGALLSASRALVAQKPGDALDAIMRADRQLALLKRRLPEGDGFNDEP